MDAQTFLNLSQMLLPYLQGAAAAVATGAAGRVGERLLDSTSLSLHEQVSTVWAQVQHHNEGHLPPVDPEQITEQQICDRLRHAANTNPEIDTAITELAQQLGVTTTKTTTWNISHFRAENVINDATFNGPVTF